MSTVAALPPRLPDAAAGPRPGAVPPRTSATGTIGPAPDPAQPDAGPPPVPASAPPNPTLRLDASLGLVVLEFRNAGGEARTIPSQRELEAYRDAARGVASAPDDRPAGTPAAPMGQRHAEPPPPRSSPPESSPPAEPQPAAPPSAPAGRAAMAAGPAGAE